MNLRTEWVLWTLAIFCLTLGLTGCAVTPPKEKESTLNLDVTSVSWTKEEVLDCYKKATGYKYTTTIHTKSQGGDKDTKLVFQGIHDFKKDKAYKVVVKQSDAALVSWEEIPKTTPTINVNVSPDKPKETVASK